MDQTIVDITEIPDVHPEDTTVMIASSGAQTISVCDIAAQTDTISNEVLSRLGQRPERICV